MISSWPEFARFASMMKLVEMRVHGKLTPEVQAWMSQFKGTFSMYEQQLAGFRRPA